MRRIILLSALVTALSLAGGCVATTSGYYSGAVVTTTTVAPDLVYVSPGVQVIADYDEPIFYADNFYWRFDGGRWYRSSWYTGGWAYYSAPPYAVARIERPYEYRRYRPTGYASGGAYVRDHREPRPAYREPAPIAPAPGPVVRDHREPRPAYREPAPIAPAPGPVVRDHREPRPAPAPAPAPAVRDHRTAPDSSSSSSSSSSASSRSSGTTRDHRRR